MGARMEERWFFARRGCAESRGRLERERERERGRVRRGAGPLGESARGAKGRREVSVWEEERKRSAR